jgi:hypothetical protein
VMTVFVLVNMIYLYINNFSLMEEGIYESKLLYVCIWDNKYET